MTTEVQLRKAALALPEVAEGTHFGMVAASVGGKPTGPFTNDADFAPIPGHVEGVEEEVAERRARPERHDQSDDEPPGRGAPRPGGPTDDRGQPNRKSIIGGTDFGTPLGRMFAPRGHRDDRIDNRTACLDELVADASDRNPAVLRCESGVDRCPAAGVSV